LTIEKALARAFVPNLGRYVKKLGLYDERPSSFSVVSTVML
jgi:hypothetical protein